ncbi:hypothetical protein Purlil1_10808 [Purpureocillium lilacinum]|uniref:Uncharacterized protein n=1 Tax=Purpureocillium lilacinum TaxID=33203 RepID=A0ABR0BLJ2_PURLI|nr:hypothetical protein Purlil1_10808 [Purpureocillium lilacinum]
MLGPARQADRLNERHTDQSRILQPNSHSHYGVSRLRRARSKKLETRIRIDVTQGPASTEDGDGEAQLVNGHAPPSRPVRDPVRQRSTRGRHVEKCRVYGGSSLGSAMLLRHREAAHVRPASGLGAQVNQSDAAGGSWVASACATAVLREGGTASP